MYSRHLTRDPLHRAGAQPIDRPSHDNVKAPTAGVLEHFVQPWPLVPPLGAADAGVVILLYDLPAAAIGDLAQLPDLVLDRLLVGRYETTTKNSSCPRRMYENTRLYAG